MEQGWNKDGTWIRTERLPDQPPNHDTECRPQSHGGKCDDCTVAAVNAAYYAGHVRGAALPGSANESGVLELFNHACDHNRWPTGHVDDAWQLNDLQCSTKNLRDAFPAASIRTFVAPENRANAYTMTAMQETGMDIFSNMGTMTCGSDCNPGSDRDMCPTYNYNFIPCQGDGPPPSCDGWPETLAGSESHCCIPPDDEYVVSPAGFQKLPGPGQIYSLPTASANSDPNDVVKGWEVNKTLGNGTDCNSNPLSIVASASLNAAKSNGLLWTVVMMHPQTLFQCYFDHAEWLEELLWQSRESLPEHHLKFVHFQDLVELKPPDSSCMTCLASASAANRGQASSCESVCSECDSLACNSCIASPDHRGSDCFFSCC